MTPKRELQIAYCLTIILLIVGVLSYAAFPAKAPEQPVRLMFKCSAGKVLFDHKIHTSDSGYGFSCSDCHHHPEAEEDQEDLRACGDCHSLSEKVETVNNQTCMECHELEDIEDSEVIIQSEAFHSQCIGCHQESEAGPEECESCHM